MLLSGEHLSTTGYSFDADGVVAGIVYRGSSTLCGDGSVRFGDRYGAYCPPNFDQPYPCGETGAGGCPN